MCPLFLSDFNKTSVFLDRFSKKTSNTQFSEIPCSGRRVVSCKRMDRRTDMTKLIVAFRKFAQAPTQQKYSKIKLE